MGLSTPDPSGVSTSLHDQADVLLQRIASQYCNPSYECGSMSPAIYDVAWLSMVEKPNGSGLWLFPQCFEYILDHQLPDGAWESYASVADGILNTAATLLSLKKHLDQGCVREDSHVRIHKATSALQQLLGDREVLTTDQVGFEILLFQHLSLLQKYHINLEFPQQEALRATYHDKISKMPVSTVYGTQSTLHHSLEALIGHIDFDRVGHCRDQNGSMMGSPASTAAYLMQASVWDDKAEQYLRNVLQRAPGNVGVPSAWPTTIFETAWVS